jgi:hypothetical protein
VHASPEVAKLKNGSYLFSSFEFTTDMFKSQNLLAQKTLVLEVMENNKVVCKTSFLLRDAMTRGYNKKLRLLLLDEKKQLKGNVELS